jgi:signal transduction histidine kinase
MPRPRTIQLELPAMIAALWTVAVVLLGSIAYAYLLGAGRAAAAERLSGVAEQVGGMLRQSAASNAAAVRGLASDTAVVRFLEALPRGGDQAVALDVAPAPAAAVQALTPREEAGARVPATELLDARGRRVLATGAAQAQFDSVALSGLLSAAGVDSGTVGSFTVVGDSLVLPVIATVRSRGERLGYVVRWFWVSSPPSRAAMQQLIGPGSSLLIGTPGTGRWTDLEGPVESPPGDVSRWAAMEDYRRAGTERLATARPVAGTPWYTVIELSADRVAAPARAFLRRALAVSLLVLLLGIGGVWIVTRRITRRLARLTAVAESISAGGGPPPQHPVGDELARLGAAFDRMSTRVRDTHAELASNVEELRAAREQFAHTQRMEAVGRLAGGVAHDFNNLLTVILGEVELALAQPAASGGALQEIRRAGERAAILTQQLLTFSRRQVTAPEVLDVNDLVRELEKMLGRLLGERVRLVTRCGAQHARVRADRGQLEQVLVNLVVNGRDAMTSGGTVTVETVREEHEVSIAVTDTGTGMTDDVRAHLFEPFFTTKERGKGSGLGLATSYGIVRQAGGRIEVETKPGMGTTMRVVLPAVEGGELTPVPAERVAPSGRETILLVEDEPGVRRIAARILVGKGYQVLTAESGEAALELLGNGGPPLHLLLTDVVLPGIGGRELADQALDLRPGLRVLFVSGYTDDVVLQHRLVTDEVHFLAKPYSPDALVHRVREVLDSPVA